MPAPFVAMACLGAALLATLALAARLTPPAWWRRPNARALAVLVLGTGIIGTGLWWIAGPAGGAQPVQVPDAARLDKPLPGRSYRVAGALNLRTGHGVGARRVTVLAAGSVVTATGAAAGDWWQVRARLDGQSVEGWASSLWLRRADEGR